MVAALKPMLVLALAASSLVWMAAPAEAAGLNRHADMVRARTTDVYHVTFSAGQTAIVIVAGDGDTDLDLYVYDENGNLIDSDTDGTDVCIARWRPRWTGRFRIEIRNLGVVGNVYTLYTSGRGARRDVVQARTTDVYRAWFRAGRPAMVIVDGDGDTDLDLYVYDEHGNLVASDTDGTDFCIACWRPRWDGRFRIEIRNLGRVCNVYTIYTD